LRKGQKVWTRFRHGKNVPLKPWSKARGYTVLATRRDVCQSGQMVQIQLADPTEQTPTTWLDSDWFRGEMGKGAKR
jgi:hypothetical protein